MTSQRYLTPNRFQQDIAAAINAPVAHMPLICPHGHVDPRLFADPDYTFGTPVDLFIVPDHYVFRMLYSQGIGLDQLGLPRRDGAAVEGDPRRIWQTFAEHFYLFQGTPTGVWLKAELRDIFGLEQKLNGDSAQSIYDAIVEKLATPEFRPRALFERFNIEVLCTTDAATDPLDHHRAIRESGWLGKIRPTFRPDDVTTLNRPDWRDKIEALRRITGLEVGDYRTFIRALENRREFFKQLGATATDHAILTPNIASLSDLEADTIFQRALHDQISAADAERFSGHMLMEMARMSVEDGLVMQIHPGAFRSHNDWIFQRFGSDMGADIPVQLEFTRNLHPLLNRYGNEPRLTLIVFTLDETTYARELAPLAGHYPALKLGPPWWFYDSPNGIARFFDQVMETAGLYNTVGFNDDTRAFCSIPARHALWRRSGANWLAGLVMNEVIDMDDANEMMLALAYGLAKRAYKL